MILPVIVAFASAASVSPPAEPLRTYASAAACRSSQPTAAALEAGLKHREAKLVRLTNRDDGLLITVAYAERVVRTLLRCDGRRMVAVTLPPDNSAVPAEPAR